MNYKDTDNWSSNRHKPDDEELYLVYARNETPNFKIARYDQYSHLWIDPSTYMPYSVICWIAIPEGFEELL